MASTKRNKMHHRVKSTITTSIVDVPISNPIVLFVVNSLVSKVDKLKPQTPPTIMSRFVNTSTKNRAKTMCFLDVVILVSMMDASATASNGCLPSSLDMSRRTSLSWEWLPCP